MKKPSVIPATELNRRSGEVLRRVALHHEHILIQRDGYPLAVIIPISEYKKSAGRAGGYLSESEEVGGARQKLHER